MTMVRYRGAPLDDAIADGAIAGATVGLVVAQASRTTIPGGIAEQQAADA